MNMKNSINRFRTFIYTRKISPRNITSFLLGFFYINFRKSGINWVFSSFCLFRKYLSDLYLFELSICIAFTFGVRHQIWCASTCMMLGKAVGQDQHHRYRNARNLMSDDKGWRLIYCRTPPPECQKVNDSSQ